MIHHHQRMLSDYKRTELVKRNYTCISQHPPCHSGYKTISTLRRHIRVNHRNNICCVCGLNTKNVTIHAKLAVKKVDARHDKLTTAELRQYALHKVLYGTTISSRYESAPAETRFRESCIAFSERYFRTQSDFPSMPPDEILRKVTSVEVIVQ